MRNLAICRSENKLLMHDAPALNLLPATVLPAIAGKKTAINRACGDVL